MTNQNDTQDEAERLAKEYDIEKLHSRGKIRPQGSFAGHDWLTGYRAGLSSFADKHLELATKYSDLAAKYYAAHAEIDRLKQELIDALSMCETQLAASRAEVERLKADFNSAAEAAMIHGTNHDNISDIYLVLRKQLAAEKARSKKLLAAMNKIAILGSSEMAYTSDFTEAVNMISREQCANYSTDSGDGVG